MADLDQIIKVFTDIKDKDTMKKFFYEIFTEKERNDLSLRWKLMALLHDNMTQRDIADNLKISLCKITRGSKILKNNGSITKKLLEKEAIHKR